MERDLVLFDVGTLEGHTIYFTVHKDGLHQAKLNKAEKHRKNKIKRLEGLLREFKDINSHYFTSAIVQELNHFKKL